MDLHGIRPAVLDFDPQRPQARRDLVMLLVPQLAAELDRFDRFLAELSAGG